MWHKVTLCLCVCVADPALQHPAGRDPQVADGAGDGHPGHGGDDTRAGEHLHLHLRRQGAP